MNTFSSKLKVYGYSAIALSISAVVLYIISYFCFFDDYIGYFSSSSFIPTIAGILLAVSCVWFLTLFVFIPKNQLKAGAVGYSTASRSVAAALAFGFIAFVIVRVFLPDLLLSGAHPTSATIQNITNIFALVAALYFIFIAAGKSDRPIIQLFLGFAVILWAALSILEAYTNNFVTMNSPFKLLLIISMMSVMLFLLYELRSIAGCAYPRAHFAFTITGVLMTLVFSLPFIVVSAFGIYRIVEFTAPAAILFLFTLFMISRLFDQTRYQSEAIEETKNNN